MAQPVKSAWPSAVFALLGSIVVIVILIYLLIINIRTTQAGRGQQVLAVVDMIGDETDQVLQGLNEANYDTCSRKNLNFMRQRLFLARYIKDIGFYKDGKLVCTTGTGLLSEPYDEGTPDFVGVKGFRIFTRQKLLMFDQPLYASSVAYGRYNVVLDLSSIALLDLSPFDWEAVHTFNDHSTHIAGQQGLYQQVHNKLTNVLFNDPYLGCSLTRPHYCVAVSMSAYSFIHSYFAIIVLGVLLCIASGIIFYSQFQYWETRHSSIRYRVKRGLKRGDFYWLFQPIVDLGSLKMVGCEALARFEDTQGAIYPDQFIPALREFGLSQAFTLSMLKTTLPAMQQHSKIPDGFSISFNIFPRDIMSMESMRQFISLADVANSRLKINFEIVEDEMLDSEVAQQNLKFARSCGVNLAVDDFGTGYSNLNQLKRLHCHVLKIDRSFVMDMEEFSVRSSLIPHIVDIANQLNMAVVAEGVENLVQQKQLTRLGVKFGQGWLFGKPMTLDHLVESLELDSCD